jgi:hypothetical protein
LFAGITLKLNQTGGAPLLFGNYWQAKPASPHGATCMISLSKRFDGIQTSLSLYFT